MQFECQELTTGCCITRAATIVVTCDKPDTSTGARVELRCSNAAHFHDISRGVDAMDVAPQVPLTHKHSEDHTGVTIRATIDQPGHAPHQMEVRNVRICDDIMSCPMDC
jgi:hypothetical protein